MDTILGILLGESYSDICALADLSMCVKYTNTHGYYTDVALPWEHIVLYQTRGNMCENNQI